MRKILPFLIIPTLLVFLACEESSTKANPNTTSDVDACLLSNGAICSTTPKGDVDTSECTAQEGEIVEKCPADEKLKCSGIDVPDHEGVQSTAYVYSDLIMGILTGIADNNKLEDACDAVPVLLEQSL